MNPYKNVNSWLHYFYKIVSKLVSLYAFVKNVLGSTDVISVDSNVYYVIALHWLHVPIKAAKYINHVGII